MSEMVERVARACEKYLHNRADLAAPINYDDLAREAIAAMREPTEEMIDAWWDDADRMPNSTWRAMIDAALK